MNDSALQGGIYYAAGELRKRESKEKITCITLRKYKLASLLIAELGTSTAGSHPLAMGNVSYKYVVDTIPLSL